ncbi:UvrD-helicase domain-containing protein [Nonlabens ponticola]|uniref:DNA 3'-5' helicase n=1 Tax=Nonlabens ponticola TaxID=2496866 RepID=A0A3S9MVW0_9FLAO|nr:UvrD-helicase domain-containing protein [Nonlabens ponticola]AZQ43365.1 ATP-dependent helicase [Nonlabens ponticola]
MSTASTTFYSASAGSGKTYTLARDFLTLLFKSPHHQGYRNILAVTFTNKAVGEMKKRILDNLNDLTKQPVPKDLQGIADHIKQTCGFDDKQLQEKAIKIQQRLLHDYAAFDIVTIDSFSHRILRTFARDIQLPDGFEIELDSDQLLSKAIHNLLSRAGRDKQLTQLLVDFTLSKIDDGKSWDIEYDLHSIAKLILSENHYVFLQQLKSKSVDDFLQLKKNLNKQNESLAQELKTRTESITRRIQSAGLQPDDFFYKASRVYKFIMQCADGLFSINPETGYVKDMATATLANKAANAAATSEIEGMRDDLVELATFYARAYGTVLLHTNIMRNLTPLSLLNEIVQELDKIKDEEQIVPIYEFNGLLSAQIKDQPAPFIYERLGERYRHYFVDEFQDTSRMQWSNLMPLIENPLVQEREDGSRGSLMLVGDAKQSIYRWRGGDADQFLDILNKDDLFMLQKKNQSLGTNWRSYSNIIDFNNGFFKFYGNLLSGAAYEDLYENYLHQEPTSKDGGYLEYHLLDPESETNDFDDPDLTTMYPPHVKNCITTASQQGYRPDEICVLVRKKKQGDELARYLVSQSMNVVSADSLMVAASPKVQLLIAIMRVSQFPTQQEPLFHFLMQYAQLEKIEDIHSFIDAHLSKSLEKISSSLTSGDDDVFSAFAKANLFQATEKVVARLQLNQDYDIRLQAFLEHVYEFSQGFESSLSSFIEQWEFKQSSLSVPAAQDPEAVTIMTIHKAKGLEFPVVIVPYCDEQIDESRDAHGWLPVDAVEFSGFDHVYISLKQECESYPEPAPLLYREHMARVEMDQINTLYVAFTRAAEQLYILATDKDGKKETYSSLLTQYITSHDWQNKTESGSIIYSRGNPARKTEVEEKQASVLVESYNVRDGNQQPELSTRKGKLWADDALEAIDKGTQLHFYLSLINTIDDLDSVSSRIDRDHSLSHDQKAEFKKAIAAVVQHPELSDYYSNGINALNEKSILLPDGHKAIPDRVIFDNNQATIIDYKTGEPSNDHKSQVNGYMNLMQQLGFETGDRILVYTDKMQVEKWD